MNRFLRFFFLVFFVVFQCQAQLSRLNSLPILNIDRRMDKAYLDSIATLAHNHWTWVSSLPPTPQIDTVRLKTLNYLGSLYRIWEGKKDSSLYYGQQLVKLSRTLKNVEFEVRGLIQIEYYYHYIKEQYPDALKINYQALKTIENNKYDPKVGWRINMNLGELYTMTEDYDNALVFLNKAQELIELGTGMGVEATVSYKINILERLGELHRQRNNFAESERFYLMALTKLRESNIRSNYAYIYSDLMNLYRKYELYDKAIEFGKKAEQVWTEIKHITGISDAQADLSRLYTQMGQMDKAIEYAQKALNIKNPLSQAREKAYFALFKAYEYKQEWKESLGYYQKMIDVRVLRDQQKNVKALNAIQKQYELDKLELQSQQAQLLQEQRLLTVQKEAEINRLKSNAEKKELIQKAQQTELQRQLETTTLKASAQQKQLYQQGQIKKLQIRQLGQEITLQNRTRNFLIVALGLLSLLGGTLFWYNRKLRNTNAKLVQKNREIEEAFSKGQTTERKRVSADLHDEIGSALSTIGIFSDLAKRKAQKVAPELVQELDRIGIKSRDTIQTMRDTIWTLNENTPQSLWERMSLFGLESLGAKGIRLDWQVPMNGQSVEVPFVTKRNLFLAFKEAVNNIVKHAEATMVRVELSKTKEALHLKVIDNGKGFDVAVAQSQGNGLHNFEERLKTIGGVASVESAIGKGTTLTFWLPLNP